MLVGVAYPYSGHGTLHSHMTAFTVPSTATMLPRFPRSQYWRDNHAPPLSPTRPTSSSSLGGVQSHTQTANQACETCHIRINHHLN